MLVVFVLAVVSGSQWLPAPGHEEHPGWHRCGESAGQRSDCRGDQPSVSGPLELLEQRICWRHLAFWQPQNVHDLDHKRLQYSFLDDPSTNMALKKALGFLQCWLDAGCELCILSNPICWDIVSFFPWLLLPNIFLCLWYDWSRSQPDIGHLHIVLHHWSLCGYWCILESFGSAQHPDGDSALLPINQEMRTAISSIADDPTI